MIAVDKKKPLIPGSGGISNNVRENARADIQEGGGAQCGEAGKKSGKRRFAADIFLSLLLDDHHIL